MRVTLRNLTLFVVAGAFVCITPPARAQGDDPVAAIQQKLKEHIVLAGLDGNGEVSTAGTIVTLKMNELQMCATPNSGAPPDAGAPANTYKKGKLSAGMFIWRLGLGISKIDPNTIPMRTYVAGEKFWIVNYNVKKNGIELKLWTDADSSNIRYWSWLEIPFDKKQTPSADEAMNTLAEVLAFEPPQPAPTNQASQPAPAPAQGGPDQSASAVGKYSRADTSDYLELQPGGTFALVQKGRNYGGNYKVDGDSIIITGPQIRGQQKTHFTGNTITDPGGTVWTKEPAPATSVAALAPVAPPPPPTQYQDLAPPPPPPAPAPTVSMGMTKAQVSEAFGEPQRKATLGVKEIFFYTDQKMKITFTNGKVSNVE